MYRRIESPQDAREQLKSLATVERIRHLILRAALDDYLGPREGALDGDACLGEAEALLRENGLERSLFHEEVHFYQTHVPWRDPSSLFILNFQTDHRV